MIHIVEGVPGSGKSYYSVNYLIENFYKYDEFYNEYVEKSEKNVLVITNIENFKPKHLNLDVLIEKYGLESFFTIENFERIQKQYKVKNIVVIIDEAQRYFDKKFYNKDVFYFFQYHRHIGADIFLITQNKLTISREIVVLAEYIIKAIPRSRQLGTFRYSFYDVDGNHLYFKMLKKKDYVFNAYQSMKIDEVTKPKSFLLYKIALGVFVIVVSGVIAVKSLHYFFVERYAKAEEKTEQTEKTQNQKQNTTIVSKEQLQKEEQELKTLLSNSEEDKTLKVSYIPSSVAKYQKNYYCVVSNNKQKICYKITFPNRTTTEEEESNI